MRFCQTKISSEVQDLSWTSKKSGVQDLSWTSKKSGAQDLSWTSILSEVQDLSWMSIYSLLACFFEIIFLNIYRLEEKLISPKWVQCPETYFRLQIQVWTP